VARPRGGLQWTPGYLIEKSLSVDNVFIFLLTFTTLAVPPAYQHQLLFWGVMGALVMRGVLIDRLHVVVYVFGALLVVSGLKFLRAQQHAPEPAHSWLIRLVGRVFPVTPGYEGPRFFLRRGGVLYMTPLFVALLMVEGADLVFAVDAIPAIYAITDDPFIVYTSNVATMLRLRALYFVLSGYLGRFIYLRPPLAAILVFVGVKMLLVDVVHVPPAVSLGVIVGILAVAVAASLLRRPAPALAEQPAKRAQR